ncbi:unnamed protein product [Adineta steineri]|uniref:Phosphatidylinositol 3-kinase n=1 Tax=Adineta steineri TaxID=433720 RepID=A0A816BNL6_9BILA|nr:unnamed protein product [Adineta steineri]CAF1611463.1 unnamed protein product [Adineta steineri]
MSVRKKMVVDTSHPNSCVTVVECEEDLTLDKIRHNTLTSSAQVIAFYDEQLKLNKLNLVDESLSLLEYDALLDEKDDLALMSKNNYLINILVYIPSKDLLLGFPLDDFASTLEGEACEARSLLNRLVDTLVQEQNDIDDKQISPVKSQNLLKQFGLISDIRPVFVQVQEQHSTSPICFNLSSSLYSSPIDIVANVISSKLSAYNPTMINEERMEIIKQYRSRYWLQAFGCEERLFGTKPLIQSHYVQTCLRLDKPLYFKLTNIENTTGNGKKRCIAMIQEVERKKSQKFGGRSNEIRQVANEKDIACRYFSLRILSGQLIPADEFDEVKIIIGLYHDTQPLFPGSIIESRSVDTSNPDWQQEIKFNITLVNLPPASKLCCSIHFHRRRKSLLISDKWICIGWANLNIFNHNSCLIQGRQEVRFWPTETNNSKTTASMYGFNERALAGINPDRSYPTIELEFPSYEYQIAALSPHNEDLEETEEDTDFYDWLRSIEFELTEQSRAELWDRRYECMHVPEALPRWLKCVNWSKRDDVLEAYKVVQNWPTKNIDPLMTALELLDVDYPDPFVRFSAVRLLDTRIDDDRLLPVILQIVQAVKNEPYHDSALARFLLKRSLLNQQVGHFFYWHSKAEIKNPQYKVRFGLLLEAYLRYCGEYAKVLGRQVRTVDKLTFIAETIQNSTHDELYNQKDYFANLLTRENYTQNLQYFRSPVDHNIELGQLDLEHCRIMSSARRPLWLRWTNGSEYAEHYFPTFDLIFKNGDDLRQDMLALQFIQMIDIIWKGDGLDLSLLPYGCLATGYCSGLIEVVKNSKTIMNIQRLDGLKGQFQFDASALYRWIAKNNPGADELKSAIDLFTRSCAGYCVITYVLGAADRYPDNIMVTERGQLFHINFGHILGNFKKKYGIRRERTKLVLIDDFVRVITNNNTDTNPIETREFRNFKKLCINGYRILRRQYRQIVCLFKLMMNCDLTELNGEADMAYLRHTFAIDLGANEQEACDRFEQVLLDSYKSSVKTRVDWVFHALHHIES